MGFCPREDFWPWCTDWNRTGVSEEARKTHYSQQTSPGGGVMQGWDLVSPSSFQNLHCRQLSSENRAGPSGHAHSLNLNQQDRDQGQGFWWGWTPQGRLAKNRHLNQGRTEKCAGGFLKGFSWIPNHLCRLSLCTGKTDKCVRECGCERGRCVWREWGLRDHTKVTED